MARPKKEETENQKLVDAVLEEVVKQQVKPNVRHAHMHAGLDLLGSKTSFHHKESDIYELEQGLLLVSRKTKRKIVVPYANIRGYELL